MIEKEYVYRVYQADGTYVGSWPDVVSKPEWSQRLLTAGTSTTVRLGRSASRRIEQRSSLLTEDGIDIITTEALEDIMAVAETNNTVGAGTDVELNYNVDVYVHYGGFENLTTEDGELLLTEASEEIVAGVGSPLGSRVFSGYIAAYDAAYGEKEYVDVLLLSNGMELAQEVIKIGTATSVTYSSTDPGVIVKGILDTDPGVMSYTPESIETGGTVQTQRFRLNTKLEGIASVHDQSDDGWWWYGDVADNTVWFASKGATPDHTFVFRKHIQDIKIRRSMEDLKNKVYFVGGDVTIYGTPLYKTYSDAASIAAWRQGLARITDRRYTLAASAERYSNKVLSRFKEPIYSIEITILSSTYDIETIKLGQMVSFANFDNYIDDILLQIVSYRYTPEAITLQLGDLLERQQDTVADLEYDLDGEQFQTLPLAPS